MSVQLETAVLSLSLLTRYFERSFTLHGSIQDAGAISPLPFLPAFLVAKSNSLGAVKGTESSLLSYYEYSFPKARMTNKLPAAGNRGQHSKIALKAGSH